MASELKNLSQPEGSEIPSASGFRFGIVISEWNHEITSALYKGAYEFLIKQGAREDNIITSWVPGSFELTLGAQYLADTGNVDAVICIGCVIQGETKHFDFICNAVANGITQLNLDFNMPFIFGVLTPNNMEQAIDRAGGKHGNKGVEAAITAIKMLALQKSLNNHISPKIGF